MRKVVRAEPLPVTTLRGQGSGAEADGPGAVVEAGADCAASVADESDARRNDRTMLTDLRRAFTGTLLARGSRPPGPTAVSAAASDRRRLLLSRVLDLHHLEGLSIGRLPPHLDRVVVAVGDRDLLVGGRDLSGRGIARRRLHRDDL